MLRHNVNNYVKRCNVCLASKTIQYKPYDDLQSLLIFIYCQKDLSMDFIMNLPISTDWKRNNYNSIFFIVNQFIKIVYYEQVKVIINVPSLAEVIIDIVVRHHGLPDLIVTNQGFFFTLKFWSLLYYFLGIKRRLFTTFYPQMDGQTERQNSMMKVYLQVFINFKQNNQVWLFPIAEIAYNNAKNANTGYTSFELNCKYHFHVFYKKNLDLCSKLKNAEKLSFELQNLMAVCQQNLYHTQKFQKQAHNKEVKL